MNITVIDSKIFIVYCLKYGQVPSFVSNNAPKATLKQLEISDLCLSWDSQPFLLQIKKYLTLLHTYKYETHTQNKYETLNVNKC